jgi:hypothetical protein
MEAIKILHLKIVLKHRDGHRLGIFEMVIHQVPKTKDFPEGIKYRAWLSSGGQTVLGFDNHKPKGPHLHVGDKEVGYVFRGIDALKADVIAMIRQEGYIYEN